MKQRAYEQAHPIFVSCANVGKESDRVSMVCPFCLVGLDLSTCETDAAKRNTQLPFCKLLIIKTERWPSG